MHAVSTLFRAIAHGDDVLVAAILAEQPAMARARDEHRLPALQFARYMGQPRILDELLTAASPLDIFEAAALDRIDDVRELLRRDASLVRALSDDGFTALHLAAYYGAPSALKALLDSGADTEAVTQNFLQNMALHAAAAGGHLEICQLLLERGADPNARQHGGFRPLHTPAFNNHRVMAELFLEHGADASLTNDEGKRPADIAAQNGHMELAALLRTR
jgi:ankyrin repeat protein